MFYLSIRLSICMYVCLSVCLSIYPSIYLHVYLSIYLSIYLFIHLPIYLSIQRELSQCQSKPQFSVLLDNLNQRCEGKTLVDLLRLIAGRVRYRCVYVHVCLCAYTLLCHQGVQWLRW